MRKVTLAFLTLLVLVLAMAGPVSAAPPYWESSFGTGLNQSDDDCDYPSTTFPAGDTTPPTIICPADVVVSTDPGVCTASGVFLGLPTVSDNLDPSPTVTNDAPAVFLLGPTTVTWTATDASGNWASCTQDVAVADGTPPVPDVDPLPMITGQCSATISSPPTATDNCAGTVTGTTTDPLTYNLQGVHIVTWTYDDGNGNTSAQTQTVVVHDFTPPVITLVGADPQVIECGDAYTELGATASDICCGDLTASIVIDASGVNTSAVGAYTVTYDVTDCNGNLATQVTRTVTVTNVAPTVDAGDDASIDEGGTFSGSGSFADPGADTWTATVDYGDGTGVVPLTLEDKTFTLSHTYADNDVYTVAVTVTDDYGGTGCDTLTVTVSNVDPTVGPITAPADPVPVGTAITASAAFTDPGTMDTHTAIWDWGDSTASLGTVTESGGSGSVVGTHIYATPGVYTINLTVTDDDGGLGSAQFEFVVVYDSDGGFVTGGGWIHSPEGAYAPEPSLTGKATFGFVSRYKKGAMVPTGQTEFQFRVADLNFHSTSYDWLVIAGARAQYKGSGTINGAGNYGFMLTAIDGHLLGGGQTDKFRIKIWDKATDSVVYDNKAGELDNGNAATELGGGSIVIHKK